MVLGFIYAKIGANHGGIIDARSPDCPEEVSSTALHSAFTAVPDLADGDLKVDHIICDISNTEAAAACDGQHHLSPAVVCVRTHRAPVDTAAHAAAPFAAEQPTIVITCLLSDSGVPTDVLRHEVSALNDFAGACVNATSKPACESIFASLLNPDDPALRLPQQQSALFSAASRSPSGLPRCVVERAVPLAFCFVPPQALGGSSLGEASEFLDRNVPVMLEERQKELTGAMPWNRDDYLTEHIIDVLRVCSSFVADGMKSDVPDLLECRQACELIPPHPSTLEPSDPKFQSTLAASLISPSAPATAEFFGRGTWFTGIFSADGAVVCATGGFFRLPMEEQVLVSTLVGQCNAAGPADCSSSSASRETRFFPDVIGQIQNQQQGNNNNTLNSTNMRRGAAAASSNSAPAVHATAIPPMMNIVETQVQFHPDTPNQAAVRAPAANSATSANGSFSMAGGGQQHQQQSTMIVMPPVEGSVIVFALDDHLRFVVGVPRHQGVTSSHGSLSAIAGGAAQRTTSEISMWAQQLLDNSLQVVSAREVVKYCSSQQNSEGGFFAACMGCCGSAAPGTDGTGVPSAGLRRISYLTPGLLRHYSVVLASSVARAKRSGRYYSVGPDGAGPVRLLEAAAFVEHQLPLQAQAVLRHLPSNTNNNTNNATNASSSTGNNISDGGGSKTSSAWARPMLRYFVQVNRSSPSTAGNSAASRYMLHDEAGGGGGSVDASGFHLQEGAAARPSSLLNAQAWKDMMRFSDLVLLDTVAPLNGLTVGLAAKAGASAVNYSVVCLASSTGTSAATTSEQYQQQTAKAVEAGRAVHASLQNVAHAALRAATTPSPFVLAARSQASHGTSVQKQDEDAE